MVERQKPTRVEATGHDDYIEEHPAYALIGASRVSSTPGGVLFGSDFRHQHYITITIRKANVRRGLNTDWTSGQQHLIEVALSEAQWATFLSTLNMGDGVPCTLNWFGGYIAGILPDLDRREQFRAEVNDNLSGALSAIDDVLASTNLRKADRDRLEHAKRELGGNLQFVAQQFDEHAEATVEKAKVEVEAYLNAAVQRAGLEALSAAPILELNEGES